MCLILRDSFLGLLESRRQKLHRKQVPNDSSTCVILTDKESHLSAVGKVVLQNEARWRSQLTLHWLLLLFVLFFNPLDALRTLQIS